MAYLGEFEQLILFSLVELGDEAYGVAIRESIEARTGRVASAGSIYTTLARLADKGFVSASAGVPIPGRAGRPRKHYVILPEGAKALNASFTRMQAMSGGLLDRLASLSEEG